jgi:hypothetical protein
MNINSTYQYHTSLFDEKNKSDQMTILSQINKTMCLIYYSINRVYEYCHKTLSNRRGKGEVIQKIYS